MSVLAGTLRLGNDSREEWSKPSIRVFIMVLDFIKSSKMQ